MDLLQEQIDYYRARAGEYDQWWLRTGRYDRGPEENARWFAEAEQLRQALEDWRPRGAVLELACGTGLWSRELARFADSLTLVDSSPEVLAINASRVEHPHVDAHPGRPLRLAAHRAIRHRVLQLLAVARPTRPLSELLADGRALAEAAAVGCSSSTRCTTNAAPRATISFTAQRSRRSTAS